MIDVVKNVKRRCNRTRKKYDSECRYEGERMMSPCRTWPGKRTLRTSNEDVDDASSDSDAESE